jgi:RNA ligase (TIGR02306 family)
MSTFAVSIERIAEVWAHPNADRLEMARLASMPYQFVIAKGSYKPGDLVVYFPIDSILPNEIISDIGLAGKLSGPDKNRVKTVRLRGQISQGVVATPEIVFQDGGIKFREGFREGEDVTEALGVTKYEPPIIPSHAGSLRPLPNLVSVYDIEGTERYAAQVDQYLMDEPVMITEKLEGSHFAASISRDGEISVCQRRYRILPVDGTEHDWYKVARTSGLLRKLPLIQQEEWNCGRDPEVITVRGEILGPGIQGNIYGLSEHQLRVFEIEIDGEPVDVERCWSLVEKFEIETVPVISIGATLRNWLGGQKIADASNGKSILNPAVMREGIVIRPLQEIRDATLGRVIIKQRSPEYLAASDN